MTFKGITNFSLVFTCSFIDFIFLREVLGSQYNWKRMQRYQVQHMHFFFFKSLSCVQLFSTLWTVAYQAPPSMGFSRQEYWSELPFPSPGDLPNPEMWTRVSRTAGRLSTIWATGEAHSTSIASPVHPLLQRYFCDNYWIYIDTW